VLLRLILPISSPVNVLDTYFNEATQSADRAPSGKTTVSPGIDPAADYMSDSSDIQAVPSPLAGQTALAQPQDIETVGTQPLSDSQPLRDLWGFIQSNILWI
jgi:hypothetical protein